MHLLQQHTIELECASESFGKQVQSNVGELMAKEFYPKLEALLDQYSIDNHLWKIETLELNLPPITQKNWANDFVYHSINQIENFLKLNFNKMEKINYENQVVSSLISYKAQAEILYFDYLNKGSFEENSIFKSYEELEANLEINEAFIKKLNYIFTENPSALIRHILNASKVFKVKLESHLNFLLIKFPFHNLMSQFNYLNYEETKLWIEFSQWIIFFTKEGFQSEAFWLSVFKDFSLKYWELDTNKLAVIYDSLSQEINKDKKSSLLLYLEIIQPIVENKINVTDLKLRQTKIKSDNLKKAAVKIDNLNLLKSKPKNIALDKFEDLYYLNNVGLIILHPFLLPLFERLKLCKNEAWINESKQERAVLLTQYMVTGNLRIAENDLVFNKFLCGMPLNNVVNTKIKLTKAEIEKCNNLLAAVIEHWKILNDTSLDGLRETFLQRDGKIVIKNDSVTEIWVEQKGVDILLSYLPWGIETVKTPWMKNYLQCNWS